MKLAVFTREWSPLSIGLYQDHVVQELRGLGVEVESFSAEKGVPADADVVWEPALAGARAPHRLMRTISQPIVATVHGAGPFTIPLKERWPGVRIFARQTVRKAKTIAAWRWFRHRVSAVIAVSNFGAREVTQVFKLDDRDVHPIHHGVDHTVYHPEGERIQQDRPYLLHVSSYKPVKNIPRVLQAYARMARDDGPRLVVIVPGFHGRLALTDDVQLRTQPLSTIELAKWYRGALAFVFPSLRETFGMPITEAMACGSPVITSHGTGCGEVAGDAALLVDPRNTGEISEAMSRLSRDQTLQETLRDAGLRRCQQFNWHRSAEQHLEVFRAAALTTAPGSS